MIKDILLDKQIEAKINDNVKHQNIGGHIITLERYTTINDILDANFNNMVIALANFVARRTDILDDNFSDMRVYYGHIKEWNLGYFVAEDEIEVIK